MQSDRQHRASGERVATTLPAALRAILAAALVLGVAAGCSPRLRVETDRKRGIDFTRYTTFAIARPHDKNPPGYDRDAAEQLMAELLEAKGYRHSDDVDSDLIVRLFARSQLRERYTTERGLEGALDIHVADGASGDIVWRGWARQTWYDSLDPDAVVRDGITQMLVGFPPKTP